MNSGPNSDSKQCTESKLGWVHQVHTLNPACSPRSAVSQPVAGRVAGFAGRVAAYSRSCRRLGQHWVSCCAPSSVSHASCAVSWYLPGRVAALYRDTASCQASSCHHTTDCIMTHPLAKLPACHDTKTVS